MPLWPNTAPAAVLGALEDVQRTVASGYDLRAGGDVDIAEAVDDAARRGHIQGSELAEIDLVRDEE